MISQLKLVDENHHFKKYIYESTTHFRQIEKGEEENYLFITRNNVIFLPQPSLRRRVGSA